MVKGKFWDTTTKRYTTIAAMGMTGWHILSQKFGWTALPEFLTKTWVGDISILVVGAAFLGYAIYMVIYEEI